MAYVFHVRDSKLKQTPWCFVASGDEGGGIYLQNRRSARMPEFCRVVRQRDCAAPTNHRDQDMPRRVEFFLLID